ncbi:MAG: lipopolysaccharide assembly protein LapA domain-containing protein [Acidimicrobiia bacterium]
MSDSDNLQASDDRGAKAPIGLVIAGLIVIAVAIFVSQNTDEVEIQFLVFSGSVPLWFLIVIFVVLGMVLGQALAWLRRRRKRRQTAA